MTVRPRVIQKWRPSLGLILVCVLLSVFALPVAILLGFRAYEGELYQIERIEVIALVLSALLTLIIAYVLTRTITKPTHALAKSTQEIGNGNRSAIRPLDAYGTREIASLSQNILDLASRLVDRTEYVHTFAAHVSHELKSPLTSIKGAAELLLDDDEQTPIDLEKRTQFLNQIITDVDRLDLLLNRLRQLANAETPTSLGTTTLSAVKDQLASRFSDIAISVTNGSDAQIPLSSETTDIIFGHLATNAQEHGATKLKLECFSQNDLQRITITDNGRGVPDGNAAAIFQPFFSTRKQQGGTGMGLEIVKTMLAAHDGTVSLIKSEDGATFQIELPHAQSDR